MDIFGPITPPQKASRLTSFFQEMESLVAAFNTPEVTTLIPARYRPYVGLAALFTGKAEVLAHVASVMASSTEELPTQDHVDVTRGIVAIAQERSQPSATTVESHVVGTIGAQPNANHLPGEVWTMGPGQGCAAGYVEQELSNGQWTCITDAHFRDVQQKETAGEFPPAAPIPGYVP